METCENKSYGLYFLHHAFDVFLFWAPLFLTTKFEYGVHFLSAVAVGIHWFMNGNRCVSTVVMNKWCNYPEDRWLDSLKNMLGLRSVNEYFHFIWIGALMFYDVWHVF